MRNVRQLSDPTLLGGARIKTLAAFGLDLPRLADGLRRLVSGAPVVAIPAVPATPTVPTPPTPNG